MQKKSLVLSITVYCVSDITTYKQVRDIAYKAHKSYNNKKCVVLQRAVVYIVFKCVRLKRNYNRTVL